MKRKLALVLVLVFALSVGAQAKSVRFSDVSKSHWAYSSILLCAEKGAVEGVTAADKNGVARFDPEGTVSLGQMLAVLTRLTAVADIPAARAEDKSWASPYYRAAINGDLIRESDFAEDELGDALTREDMAYLLVRAARANGEILENTVDAKIYAKADIRDFIEVSSRRQDFVLQAYINGLLSGYDNGNFGPQDTATRAQMAVIVCRLMEYQPRIEVNYCDLPAFNDGSGGG